MGIGQRVILVIAHHNMRFARLYHAPCNRDRQANTWPAINQVAQKNYFAPRVAINTAALVVTQLLQQSR